MKSKFIKFNHYKTIFYMQAKRIRAREAQPEGCMAKQRGKEYPEGIVPAGRSV